MELRLAAFTTPSSEELTAFLDHFVGIRDARLFPVTAGTVNSSFRVELQPSKGGDSRVVFLRIYEEQDHAGAAHEARLLGHLARGGAKTPAPIVAPDGATLGVLAGRPAALFPWIPGEMRCQESVSTADLEALGRELGTLHDAAAGAPEKETRFGLADLQARLDVVARSDRSDLAARVPSIGALLEEAAASRIPEGRCMVHGDVFRDNVLFCGAELTSVLDFESAGLETPTYDIAVALLAWTYGAGLRGDLVQALLRGYRSVRPAFAGRDATRRLFFDARFAALRFMITRLTDCELRGGKKDFRRFEGRYRALEAIGVEGFVRAFG